MKNIQPTAQINTEIVNFVKKKVFKRNKKQYQIDHGSLVKEVEKSIQVVLVIDK